MRMHLISASQQIESPAQQLYDIISDYHNGHPHILPKPEFVRLDVEQGGVGSGTVIAFQMRLLGQLQSLRATITEPEPGRRLVESADNGVVTTFIVEPRGQGQQALVTITSDMPVRDGVVGNFQGWLFTRLLKPLYVRELAQLAEVAASRTA